MVTKKEAIRIAIKAIDNECQKLAVNANLYEMFGLQTMKSWQDKRKKYSEAKRVLQEIEK